MRIYDPITNLVLTWGLGEIGTLVDTYESGCVIWAITVEGVVGAVTPISVETGMAMVAPNAVGTLASNVGVDICIICAC